MESVTVRLLECPTDVHIEQAVNLLLRAFDGDISVRCMTDGNGAFQVPLFRSMLRAGALEGAIYVVTRTEEPDEFSSIGLCYTPGFKMFNSEAQLAAGWTDFLGTLSDEGRDWWMSTFQDGHEKVLEGLLGSKYLYGWFVNIIATDPQHQKKGYGTVLVRAICEKAKADNTIVALATQTQKNAMWYQHLGFKLLGKSMICSSLGDWPDYFLQWDSEPQ